MYTCNAKQCVRLLIFIPEEPPFVQITLPRARYQLPRAFVNFIIHFSVKINFLGTNLFRFSEISDVKRNYILRQFKVKGRNT